MPCFRSSSTISAMPTPDAILRASGKLTVLRGRRPDEAIEHRKRQRPPCRKGLIRRARQHDDGRLADAPDGRGAAGLQGNAMGENLAARSQCGHRRVGAADAGAADDQEQIARAVIERRAQSMRHRGPAAVKQTVSAPAARALSAIRSAVTLPPGILTMRSRGRRTLQSLQSRGARDQEIARPHAPPGLGDETSLGDIAARPAHALPRDRLRQHLRQRPGQIDGIGIEHAVASRPAWPRRPRPRPAASTTAAANRRMRRRDRARGRHSRRRRRRRAADRPAAAAFRRRCNAALRRAAVPPARPVPRRCSRASSATSSGVSEVGRRWGEVMARLCPESARK